MAKSKNSKILAMALCASVMAGIYASPVMAADVNANFDSDSGNIVFTIAGDTYTIKKDDITKAIERNHIHSNGQISANAGFTANGGNYYAIRGTNNQYTMLANEKYFALGSGGLLKGHEGSDNYNTTKERATFYVDNATGNVTTKGTLSGTGLTAEGASGGLYVRDVVDGKTMIYTKAADADGTNTVWIDPENGNISTIGTVGVTDDLESGKLITQIQGSGENIGDIAVGIQYDGEGNITGQNIVLDASTGDVISKGDVTTLNDDGTVNYSLNTIGANTAGIERIQNGAGNDITEIEDTLRIYDNGTISTVNGAFRINNQGNVFANAVNVADGTVVISENSINAFDSKFTVNENGGVSTTGINVAEGMFTASDGGVTMANNNLSVDLNGNIKAGTYNGVKIGMNEDGDIIDIDIPTRKLNVLISDDEMAKRKAAWVRPEPKVKTGYLSRYAKLTTSANTGAVLE